VDSRQGRRLAAGTDWLRGYAGKGTQLRRRDEAGFRGRLMPCHVTADLGQVGLTGACLVDNFAVEDHDQPVREFQ